MSSLSSVSSLAAISFHESRLVTVDGASLFARCAAPSDGAPRGTVLLVHGMGEHSARYFHVAGWLVEQGFRVCAFDLRGHGRSEGRRGDIASYDLLLDDLDLVWKKMIAPVLCEHSSDTSAGDATLENSDHAIAPVFLYGHSLGGQLAINFAAENKPAGLCGLIVTSPWLELAFVPARWKLLIARLTLKLCPSFTQKTDVKPERLSRDLAFLASLSDLHLVHHRMSARMYFELVRGAAQAQENARRIFFPMLLIHGARDPVTSWKASQEFFKAASSEDKTLHIYPEALHETHNDIDREIVRRDLLAWLDAHCGCRESV